MSQEQYIQWPIDDPLRREYDRFQRYGIARVRPIEGLGLAPKYNNFPRLEDLIGLLREGENFILTWKKTRGNSKTRGYYVVAGKKAGLENVPKRAEKRDISQ